MDIILWNHTVYSVSYTLGFYALVQLYVNISYFLQRHQLKGN